MKETYIHEALNAPGSNIRIYANCSAEKLTYTDEIVDGVEGNFLDKSNNTVYKLRVNARLVVIAASAIASTHILLKNHIAQSKAGKNLALHPVTDILGDFPFEIKGSQGIPMAYAMHDFSVINGVEEGGFLIEEAFLAPLEFSMTLPVSERLHMELMKRYNHYAMAGVLVRDGNNGTITLTDGGKTRISYSLGARELDDIARSTEIIARMWFGLGATKIVTSHIRKSILNSEDEIPELVSAIKNDSKNLMMASFHPQGGNRMGDDENTCVVDSDCKVYGFRNLFVCDASVFPTAVGVNPQLSIMSLAAIIADRINSRWDEFSATLKMRRGEVCTFEQPMYCSTSRMDEIYEISDSMLNDQALVNSINEEIVDGENWSFDIDTLTIWNNRYWKGFYPGDHTLINKVLIYAAGFNKRFYMEGTTIKGDSRTYESPIKFAIEEVRNAEYPGFGKVLLLKYEPPFNTVYDLMKIVDKDTIIGKAYTLRDAPRGEHILTFSLSKKYGVDFMTHDDFKAIFSLKARKPGIDEVLGVWEGRLVSDSVHSPVLFTFRFYEDQGELKCRYVLGGIIPGTSKTRFSEEMMQKFDFNGQVFRDEIRMVRRDFMLGKYCTGDSPVFELMKKAPGFMMKDDGRVCLAYTLRRVA